MGGSLYSDAIYSSRMTDKKAYSDSIGVPDAGAFTHHADISAGRVAKKVHEKLDPSRKNAAGKIIRESFDSDVHPDSRAVAVLFDVTGSMHSVPKLFVEKLSKLMATIVKKGYLPHPHVLFGAIGDATCDSAPLQIGQFEGGNEMDEALSLVFLEAGGGGHITESYELAMYFMSRHTDLDCFNKRSQKGYLFILGDETPYPRVSKKQVADLIGDILQEDIPTDKLLEELRDKFEVFWIVPADTAHARDPQVIDPLRKMFGQNLLLLDNPDDVSELIASTIGVTEGYDLKDIGSDLKDMGADAGTVSRATGALVSYAGSKSLTKAGTASGALVGGGKDKVERL